MAQTFILSSTASDLGGGADFSAALVASPTTAGQYDVSVSAGATDISYGFTAAGVPGTSGVNTGTFTVEVNVTVANANIQISAQLHRVSSGGVTQGLSSAAAEQSGGSTGVKTFTFTDPTGLGTWTAGDRLRVSYRFRSTAAHGNTSISIASNTVSCEVVTPFAGPPPNTGSSTGTHAWAGVANGSAPSAAPPNTGSATGTHAWAGTATGSAPSSGGGGGPFLIALIHDDPTPNQADTDTQTFLENAGHTVDMVSEAASPPAGYDVIIISESGSSGSVAPYDTVDTPVMVWETAWNSLRLSTGAASSQTSSTQVDLVGHDITTGLSDPLTYLTAATSTYGVATSSLPAGVEVVATDISVATHAFAIVADEGATLTSGTAPARRAAMGLISSRPSSLTADGQALVLAIVDWLGGAGGSAGPSLGSASGTHQWAGVATGTHVPQPPTGLTATPVSASQVDLAWDAVTGATGYDIERDGAVIVFGHASTSYSDEGLDPATEYDYRVRTVM